MYTETTKETIYGALLSTRDRDCLPGAAPGLAERAPGEPGAARVGQRALLPSKNGGEGPHAR